MSKGYKYSKRREPLQERSQQMIEWILEAAFKLFSESGYEKTTTNEIAELAGVSIGAFYYYFPGKDAILVELGKRHRQRMYKEVLNIIEDNPDEEIEGLTREIVTRLVQLHEKEPLIIRALNESTLIHKYLDSLKLKIDSEFWNEIEKKLVDRIGVEDPKRVVFFLKEIILTITHNITSESYCGTNEEIIESLTQVIMTSIYKKR